MTGRFVDGSARCARLPATACVIAGRESGSRASRSVRSWSLKRPRSVAWLCLRTVVFLGLPAQVGASIHFEGAAADLHLKILADYQTWTAVMRGGPERP